MTTYKFTTLSLKMLRDHHIPYKLVTLHTSEGPQVGLLADQDRLRLAAGCAGVYRQRRKAEQAGEQIGSLN